MDTDTFMDVFVDTFNEEGFAGSSLKFILPDGTETVAGAVKWIENQEGDLEMMVFLEGDA